MKAYLATTGTVFGLVAVAHVLRMILENPRLAIEPWYLGLTGLAAILSGWAWRLLWLARRRPDGSQ